MAPAPVTAARSYSIDDRLQAVLREAIEAEDGPAQATARLAVAIRSHRRFDALVERMAGVAIPSTPRGLSRTSKTALIGQPEPETAFAKAHALARVIADDLVAEPERAGATALALVLAEECRCPASKRRLHVEQPAT